MCLHKQLHKAFTTVLPCLLITSIFAMC